MPSKMLAIESPSKVLGFLKFDTYRNRHTFHMCHRWKHTAMMLFSHHRTATGCQPIPLQNQVSFDLEAVQCT